MITESLSSVLVPRMSSLYLRARWFWGAGMVVIPVVFGLLVDDAPGRLWAISAAGAAIVVHSLGLALWRLETVVSTLFIDIAVAHVAVMVLSFDELDHSSVLLTAVGLSVLTLLFTDGWAKWLALALNAVLTFVTLMASTEWALASIAGPFIGGIFVTAVVIYVIEAFRKRIADVELDRAVTLGVASHELRNRLAGVIGVSQLLSEGGVAPDSDEGRELLEMAHREAVEAGSVIEDILTVSRSERGVLETHPVPTDLGEMVRNVARTFDPGGEVLTLKGADPQTWVMADPLRAPQVLRNLLTNAQRYGGPDIRMVVLSTKDSASVMVSDDGEGVHAGDVPALFSPYHRSKHGQPAPGSTGLGLWISRNLMRSMGGDLSYRRVDFHTVFEAVFETVTPPRQSRPTGAGTRHTRAMVSPRAAVHDRETNTWHSRRN